MKVLVIYFRLFVCFRLLLEKQKQEEERRMEETR